MRLGQLSRKTGTRTADIVNFLSQKGIQIEDSVNHKVDDDYTRLVISHFAPGLMNQENAVEDLAVEGQQNPPDSEPLQESLEEQAKEMEKVDLSNASSPELTVNSPDFAPQNSVPEDTLPSVIKAQKVELQGLKVLGKIDLPSPKKKDVEEAPAGDDLKTETPLERTPRRNEKRNRQENLRPNERRGRKNPIALQREREEMEAAERKKEIARQEKEKRTQFYQQRVKPPAPVRAARLVEEPLAQLHDEAPDQPKTWWGKFMKWLTT
jgi:hypothetical protein